MTKQQTLQQQHQKQKQQYDSKIVRITILDDDNNNNNTTNSIIDCSNNCGSSNNKNNYEQDNTSVTTNSTTTTTPLSNSNNNNNNNNTFGMNESDHLVLRPLLDKNLSISYGAHSITTVQSSSSDELQEEEDYGGLLPTSSSSHTNHGSSTIPVGNATMIQEIASMTKNLIGCGALSLSNGIALCTNNGHAGVIASIFWISIMGIIYGYFCWLIGKICSITNSYTYRTAWEASYGSSGSLLVSIANTLKAVLALLAYASILTDSFASLLESIDIDFIPRTTCLLLISSFLLLPLCLLKNLQLLAPFSMIGTAGIFLTTIAMFIRYIDGTYTEPNGIYYQDLVAVTPQYQPLFGTMDNTWTLSILPFVCMVYEAYVMHYNSPRFYRELKDRSLPRFGIAVGTSFGTSAIMYAGIACFGFLTFGGNSSSFILNNYSPYDPLATVCRLAVGISTLTSYPIVFMGVRDGILDCFQISIRDQTDDKLNIITITLICILTFISIFVHDLGLINAVGGGLVATAIVFVFPTMMFISIMKDTHHHHYRNMMMGNKSFYVQWEITTITILTIIGVILGLIGAFTAVEMAEFKSE